MANKQEQEETAIEKLNSNLTSAGEKIANNKKTISLIISGIAVVAAAVVAYVFLYHQPQTNKAFEAYNQVEVSATGNDSIAAIEYKKVAEAYSSTDAGKLAYLSAAESFYNTGKYKEAVECLDKFSTSEKVLDASAMVLKGDCFVNLKKYDDAIASYEKAVSAAGENIQIVPRVLLKEANVYDEQKKFDKALECYERLAKEYPTFELGNGAAIDSYIAREKARLGK